MEFLFGIVYIGVLMYMANRQLAAGDRAPIVFLMLIGLLIAMGYFAVTVLLLALVQDSALGVGQVSVGAALMYLLFCAGCALLSVRIINSLEFREIIARRIVRSGESVRRYDPENIVHTTALVLVLFVLVAFMASLLVSGGVEGVADSIEAAPPTIQGLLMDAMVYILAAMLGVGLFIRRTLPQSLERLGLRWPESSDIRTGVLAGLGLYVALIVVATLWTMLLVPGTDDLQTAASQQIFAAFSGSLFAGFMLALASSVGEEILFRGALQPVFGIFLTSLFFALLHMQYAFTPASIIIFGIAFGFGLVRQRSNTTAAIIAHFVYNFIPFVLVFMLNATSASV